MNGPWHYTEAERLLAEASEQLDEFPDEPIAPLLQRALVHATLASTAATAQSQLFDDEDTTEWLRAFGELAEQRAAADGGHPLDAEIVEGEQGDLQLSVDHHQHNDGSWNANRSCWPAAPLTRQGPS